MRLQSWQDAGRATGRARRGFTLIELLAVIVILSILAYFLVTNVFAARETVEIQATRATLAQVAAAIGEYADETGDWPPSDFPEAWGPAPGKVNLGGEALYLRLCAAGRPGEGRLERRPAEGAHPPDPVRPGDGDGR